MDEEISIIDSKTRNEKVKNFFINNKKSLIVILSSIVLIVFAYFSFAEIQDRKIKILAEKYNNILITPHVAGCTINAMQATELVLAKYIVKHIRIQNGQQAWSTKLRDKMVSGEKK